MEEECAKGFFPSLWVDTRLFPMTEKMSLGLPPASKQDSWLSHSRVTRAEVSLLRPLLAPLLYREGPDLHV